MVVLLVALTLVALIIVWPLLQKRSERKPIKVAEPVLSGYMFTQGHLWLNRLTSGRYRLGLDELVLRFMGNPDKIHLIDNGEEVKAGEPLAIISRKGKEIYLRAPVATRIIKANRELAIQPNMIGLDPYRRGWLYQVELIGPKMQLGSLLSGEKARAWINKELSRLKDFAIRNQPVPAIAGETMFDGGKLVEGVIDHLDQPAVGNFERQFLMGESPHADDK